MDPWLGRKHLAAFRQSCMAKFFELVQRRNFGLEILLQISFRVGRDFALCQIEAKGSQRCHDNHYRGEQPRSKACYTFVSSLDRRSHGKSTCSVSPSFNSTGFSSVVLLSIQAFSVYRAGGGPVNRNCPSMSVITKY